MEILSSLLGGANTAISYIIPFLFVLTLVVFFHELGHFSIARWRGVRVEVFSIGFGREIYGWNDRHGTRWKIGWLPLGGYVKFWGDESAASNPDRDTLEHMTAAERQCSFHFKRLWERAAIVAAGPLANFALAIVIFTLLFSIIGQTILSPTVDEVREGSAAEQAGFQAGDVILAIDGEQIASFSDMQRIVTMSADTELSFLVDRAGEEIVIAATPERSEITDRFGNVHKVGLLGITRKMDESDVTTVRYDPLTASVMAVDETVFVVTRTMGYLWGVIAGVEDADQLGGPLRIAQVSGQVASVSFIALIHLAAVLSISIGLINLFPVPMLDGGHLMYYGIEALQGKPLGEQAQEYGYRIGLALVLMLMIFATWNDLVHLDVF